MNLRSICLAFWLVFAAACSADDVAEPGDQRSEGVPGAQGPTAAPGAPGPKGDPGVDGVNGEKGDQGDQGEQGHPGATGENGAQGPSGIVKVLSFSALAGGFTTPGNNGNIDVVPNACRTATYTAGPNEIAVYDMDGTATPSAAVSDVIYLAPVAAVDGAKFMRQVALRSAESMADGTAHATVHVAVPLKAGSTYTFGLGFSTNNAQNLATVFCQGTVLVVRQ